MPGYEHVIQAYHKGRQPRLALPGKGSADSSESEDEYLRRRRSPVNKTHRSHSNSARSDAGRRGENTFSTKATVNHDMGPTNRGSSHPRPRSVDPRGREIAHRDDRRLQRRYSTSSSSSSSDSEPDSQTSRRRRRNTDRRLAPRSKGTLVRIVPCGTSCNDHPDRKAQKAREADDGSGDDPKILAEQYRKHNHTRILYGGLAAASTLATCNGVYQSIKARRARVAQLNGGERCQAEHDKLKAEHTKRDLMALGIAAVGLYNVKVNWRRFEGVGK